MHPSLPIVSGVLSAASAQALALYFSQDVGDRSDEYAAKNALLPMNASFAIWGPIYLGLAGLTIAQALPRQREELAPARPWLAALPPIHLAWFFVVRSNQSFLYAMLVQSAMFAEAIKLHASLDGIHRVDATPLERTLRAVTGLYVGWLGAANLPGWTAAALESGWDGETPSPRVWGTAGAIAGSVAGALLTEKTNNPWVELSFVNALAGIAVRQWRDERPVVAVAAGVGALLGGARFVHGLWTRHRARQAAMSMASQDIRA